MYPSADGCVRDEITKRSRTHVIHPFSHPPFPIIYAARLVRLSGPVTTMTTTTSTWLCRKLQAGRQTQRWRLLYFLFRSYYIFVNNSHSYDVSRMRLHLGRYVIYDCRLACRIIVSGTRDKRSISLRSHAAGA